MTAEILQTIKYELYYKYMEKISFLSHKSKKSTTSCAFLGICCRRKKEGTDATEL